MQVISTLPPSFSVVQPARFRSNLVFCFFSFGSLWGQDCGELFQKLSQIPNALETITKLKELYTPSPEDSSNQVQLRKSATLSALNELNSKLQSQGVAISPREFVSLFPYLEKEIEEIYNPKPKTKPETSKPIEIPKEILEESWQRPGSSFINRNHADALKFKVPEKFKIVEMNKHKIGGAVESSPVFGPEGLMAVTSNNNHLYFFKLEPRTHDIKFLYKHKMGTWGPSSPAFGPDGVIAVGSYDRAVGSNDNNIYFFQHNPLTHKIDLLDKKETKDAVDSSPTFGPDGLIAVGSNDNHIYFFKHDPNTQKIKLLDKKETGDRIFSSPAFGPDGLIAVGSDDKHIYFFKHNPQTDKIQFLEKHKTEASLRSSPAFGPDGLVAVGSNDNHVYFFKHNPRTHKVEFLDKKETEGAVYSSPAFGPDGLMAVGSNDKAIYFYKQNPQTHKIEFLEKHRMEGAISSSPAFEIGRAHV